MSIVEKAVGQVDKKRAEQKKSEHPRAVPEVEPRPVAAPAQGGSEQENRANKIAVYPV